jgi:hypothetical protein
MVLGDDGRLQFVIKGCTARGEAPPERVTGSVCRILSGHTETAPHPPTRCPLLPSSLPLRNILAPLLSNPLCFSTLRFTVQISCFPCPVCPAPHRTHRTSQRGRPVAAFYNISMKEFYCLINWSILSTWCHLIVTESSKR